MRYDTLVEFILPEGVPIYDTITGAYLEPEPSKRAKFCHVYDLSTSLTLELFGRLDIEALAVHCLGNVIHNAEIVEIHGKRYRVKKRRQMQNKASYIVSEVLA